MTPNSAAPIAAVIVRAIAVVARNHNLIRATRRAIVAAVLLALAVTWLEKLLAEYTTTKQLGV